MWIYLFIYLFFCLGAGVVGCGKFRPPTGIRSPDLLARSEYLYRLRYPGQQRGNVRYQLISRIMANQQCVFTASDSHDTLSCFTHDVTSNWRTIPSAFVYMTAVTSLSEFIHNFLRREWRPNSMPVDDDRPAHISFHIRSNVCYNDSIPVTSVKKKNITTVLDFKLSPCTEYSKFPLG